MFALDFTVLMKSIQLHGLLIIKSKKKKKGGECFSMDTLFNDIRLKEMYPESRCTAYYI